ncbi:MAG TPA: SRPBCC domain-containing protein [bacterium]|nr:SRPBCC domain-containing protein [bacterium]
MTQGKWALVIQRTINASAERLFDAWTKPELMKQWFRGSDMATPVAETDPRVDGAWKLVMTKSDGKSYPHHGHYKVFDRPHKLVFTWNPFDGADDDTTVTLVFKKVSETVTELTLTHEGFKDEEIKTGHDRGWNACLDTLNKWVTA